MTLEADLTGVLKGKCPRVHADVAPLGTPKPYLTYQGIGGQSWHYLENTLADNRNTLMQVSAWAANREAALALIREIEPVLMAATEFQATPQSEPMSLYDEETKTYGSVQRYFIVSAR